MVQAKREQDLGAVASNGQLASGASSRPGSEASSRDRKRSAVQAQLETEECVHACTQAALHDAAHRAPCP